MQCAEIFDFVLVLPMKIGQKIIPYTTLVKLKKFSALSWLHNLYKKKYKIQLIFIVLWIYNFGIASGLILISVRVVSVSSKLWRDFAISQSF